MDAAENIVFALDIGTRKIAGLVARQSGERLKIFDAEIIEHASRAMLDGQIHNVHEVAKAAALIKERLEQRLGIRLNKAGVAVAGRSLRTVPARKEREISHDEEINEDAVRNLELEAVSGILSDVNQRFGQGDYYCAGYSVIHYELDGEVIGDLRGHYGRKMAVDVIATFLPRIVLESMLSVLRKVGLEVLSLTLEPIAAINAIIPRDMRRLNLVLLDVGAGTSDIALTMGGTVFAYGMVAEAGDEITEVISEKYIVDFNTAEQIKRTVSCQNRVRFKDILGREHDVASGEIIAALQPRVHALADCVANAVMELNEKKPHAVVLIGGGSRTPLLDRELARAFALDQANVGVRLPEMIEGVDDATGKLNTPEMVTPIGILAMTAGAGGLKFMELFVNEKRVQVLDMQQSMDVLGALVASGFDHRQLYGRIGRALCVEVNGQLKVIKGGMGRPAQIAVNGDKADLSVKVRHGDHISFRKAEDGRDAAAKIRDVIDVSPLRVTVNGAAVEILPLILMNESAVDLDADLSDHARIEYRGFARAGDVLEKAGISLASLEEREIIIRVNKEPRVLTQNNFTLLIDGKPASLDRKVQGGAAIVFENNKPAFYRIRDVVDIPPPGKNVSVALNGQIFTVEGSPGKIFLNGQPVGPDEFLIDRAEITTRPGDNVLPTVAHVLKYIAVNPEEQKGKMLKITVNGRPGGFTTPLPDGGQVNINFIDREPIS